MKQSFNSNGVLLLLFLLFSYTTAARLLATRQGEEEVKATELFHKGPMLEIKEDSWNLMGVEDCDNGDEECLKRRMISEAHLDYIYTQHHKP